MIVTLSTERIRDPRRHPRFPRRERGGGHPPHDRKAAYALVERTLVRFGYHFGLSRAGKGLLRKYFAKVTGYSGSQLTWLIEQQCRTGHIRDHRLRSPSRPFATVYHDRRRDTARRGGRGLRPALGTGYEADPVAHVPCLRRQALRAPGGDFERPHLQLACSPGVPACPDHVPRDAGARRRRSDSGAGPGRRAARASRGATPCTAATATARFEDCPFAGISARSPVDASLPADYSVGFRETAG